jgi:cell division protein FtsW
MKKHPDYFLIALFILLTAAGLVILASASADLGKLRFDDSGYYVKHQVMSGLLPGILGFLVALWIPPSFLKRFALPFLLITLGFLVLVLFTPLGVSSGGASRWIHLGPVTFQPAELLKITFILYLAAWLSNARMDRAKDFRKGALPFLISSAVVAGLLVLQPATSTVVILLAAGIGMYFVSGVPIRHLLGIGAVGIVAFVILIWSTPYRLQRVMTFLGNDTDTRGSAYQINQAVMTIGSGRMLGVGYGQSTSKVNYLPAPLDDSIFAVAAQELGFVGAAGIVILFAMLVFRLLYLSRKVHDRFASLSLMGFGIIFGLQAFVNMASISGLIPLTGVPLPFVSYGGTALAVFLTIGGISVHFSRTA